MRASLSLILVAGLTGLWACAFEPVDMGGGEKVTLTLTRGADGALDCNPPADCENLPYGGDCAIIRLEIDTATGQACQECVLEDGTVIDEGCSGSAIDCVVVTLPDPDCVVCAYVNGAVVFSTCTPQPPRDCLEYVRPDGVICEVCFDAAGNEVFDSCLPDCSTIACAAVMCAPGFEPRRVAGDCCEQCVPIDNCEQVVCPTDHTIPDCPPGTELVRDPVECCSYFCEPTECGSSETTDPGLLPPELCASDADCPPDARCIEGICEAVGACPPGYVWLDEYPYCGQCVLIDDERLCLASAECYPDEYCAFDQGTCGSGSSADPETGVCYGVCWPSDPVCDNTPTDPSAPCDGEWVIEYDAAGCPFLVCLCPDGTVSLDGVCRDLCDQTACIGVIPPECGPGFYVDFFHPYCCGVCVPNDLCAYYQMGEPAPTDPNAAVWACEPVVCAPGFVEALDPVTCCPICVAEEGEWCANDADCNSPDLICVIDTATCDATLNCDPATGETCVCYGQCVPASDPLYSRCEDSDGGVVPEIPGAVSFTDGSGTTMTESDTCTADGLAVIEMYCYEGPNGRFVDEVVIECGIDTLGAPGQCREGACVR